MMAPMPQAKRNLYEILGVAPEASDAEIRRAYNQLRDALERAVPQDASEAALLRSAYETLSNPARRAAYDAALVTASEKAAAAQAGAEPDLVVEDDEAAAPRKRPPWGLIALGGAAVLIVLLVVGRMHSNPVPPPPPVAEAPKPEPPPPPPPPRTPAQILAATLPAVARVQGLDMSGRARPIGLAVSVEPGVMVTTCHGMVANTQLIATSGKESRSASLAINDEVLDLCKLAVAGLDAKPVALSDREPAVGDKIYALGANAAGDIALTEGTIKGRVKTPNGDALQISVPIAAAGSGGPVLDADGRLVGIGTTPHSFGAGVDVALPAGWIAQARTRARS
jgi:serine protease Do